MAKDLAKTFHFSDRVINHKSGHGAAGLRVEAWETDLLVDDLLGNGTTVIGK